MSGTRKEKKKNFWNGVILKFEYWKQAIFQVVFNVKNKKLSK